MYETEMTKILDFSGFEDGYGLTTELIHPDHLVKKASAYSPELVKYLHNLLEGLTQKDKSEWLYFINSALGSFEYWGSNTNGDAFEEEHLLNNQDKIEASRNFGKWKNIQLPHYKTFNQGHLFKHHINQDPKKKIGDILDTFYNKSSRRPELVIRIRRMPETKRFCEILDAGDPLPTSMGFRALEDHCSVCGNAARKRSDYCDHLKRHMNEVMPNGKVVCAFNRRGRFFDMSIVRVNADKISFALQKVAYQKNHNTSIFCEKETGRVH